MINIFDLHDEEMKNPEYREAYEALEPEFAIASALIKLRKSLNLSQAALADLMDTQQAVISRLESGQHNPTFKTLTKIAQATGTRLTISFDLPTDDTPDPETMILES